MLVPSLSTNADDAVLALAVPGSTSMPAGLFSASAGGPATGSSSRSV
jgi:hypothetical protein